MRSHAEVLQIDVAFLTSGVIQLEDAIIWKGDRLLRLARPSEGKGEDSLGMLCLNQSELQGRQHAAPSIANGDNQAVLCQWQPGQAEVTPGGRLPSEID